MQKKTLILIVLVLVLGFIGIYLFKEREGPQEEIPTLQEAKETIMADIAAGQNLKVFTQLMIYAYGEVSEILDHALVLTAETDSLKVPIEDGVKITSIDPALEKEITLEDIKIGKSTSFLSFPPSSPRNPMTYNPFS